LELSAPPKLNRKSVVQEKMIGRRGQGRFNDLRRAYRLIGREGG